MLNTSTKLGKREVARLRLFEDCQGFERLYLVAEISKKLDASSLTVYTESLQGEARRNCTNDILALVEDVRDLKTVVQELGAELGVVVVLRTIEYDYFRSDD